MNLNPILIHLILRMKWAFTKVNATCMITQWDFQSLVTLRHLLRDLHATQWLKMRGSENLILQAKVHKETFNIAKVRCLAISKQLFSQRLLRHLITAKEMFSLVSLELHHQLIILQDSILSLSSKNQQSRLRTLIVAGWMAAFKLIIHGPSNSSQ